MVGLIVDTTFGVTIMLESFTNRSKRIKIHSYCKTTLDTIVMGDDLVCPKFLPGKFPSS